MYSFTHCLILSEPELCYFPIKISEPIQNLSGKRHQWRWQTATKHVQNLGVLQIQSTYLKKLIVKCFYLFLLIST